MITRDRRRREIYQSINNIKQSDSRKLAAERWLSYSRLINSSSSSTFVSTVPVF